MENNKRENLLTQCEAVIREGLESIQKVDRALSIINNLKLYKQEYKDFETYCQENWHMKNSYTHLYFKKDKNEQ